MTVKLKSNLYVGPVNIFLFLILRSAYKEVTLNDEAVLYRGTSCL